ncbi:Fc receptor-like A isoform X2 [Pithys albifrons albifrons]|uniref:Fc receptor-like A isoform X2 n=1 Tax=Pithys albifrons albifrons TaxID=3385563 RepID=UPI003A5CB169
MDRNMALLLWAHTLVLTGAQTIQLLLEPPWMPAVLWTQVILTCQGSATPGATTWYKDGKRWWQKGPDRFSVTDSGTYKCTLVLQVPARALLEGDTVTLRCRCSWHSPITEIRFYNEKKGLQSFEGTELTLSPLQLHHSGCYHCRAKVVIGFSQWWKESAPVTVTVHELFPVPVLEGPTEPTEGSPLNLSCLSTPSHLRPQAPLLHLFYRDGVLVGGPQGSSHLWLPAVGVSHSGNYTCEVRSELGAVRKSSSQLCVTVLMPVANATITPGPPSPQAWAVATEVGGSLLFLLLVLGAIVGWHWWHHTATRKTQDRAPPDPPVPVEKGEVLYTHVMVTEQVAGPPWDSSSTTSPWDPQVTYAELLGPNMRLQEPNKIYETMT